LLKANTSALSLYQKLDKATNFVPPLKRVGPKSQFIAMRIHIVSSLLDSGHLQPKPLKVCPTSHTTNDLHDS